jgi:chemotaxis protein methyltransferase CheR
MTRPDAPLLKLEPTEFASLEALVSQKTGLRLDRNRHDDLAHTLSAMLEAAGAELFADLYHALSERDTNDPLWRQFIERITIGETYFFRDAAQCNALQQKVLPDLIAQRRAAGFRHFSLWSAGCATGEEPYSMAIMLRELIPDITEWTFTILGTDINATSLEFARQGIYKARSFREETRDDVQERWFTERGSSFELNPAVRKMVAFAPLNLVSDDYPSFENQTTNLDLIICRNVTIYFEEATTRQIIERFHSALNDGGWLVVGHAELAASVHKGLDHRNFPNAVLYQKRPETVTASPIQIRPIEHPKPVVEIPATRVEAPAPSAEIMDALEEARAAAGREDWEVAQRWLLHAERDNPMDARVHYLRGLTLLHRDEYDAALQALRRAVYCDSSFALAHYALGDLYERRGHYREARRCWLRSLRTLADRSPQDDLAPGDGVTVEMFRDLLDYRLGRLP